MTRPSTIEWQKRNWEKVKEHKRKWYAYNVERFRKYEDKNREWYLEYGRQRRIRLNLI